MAGNVKEWTSNPLQEGYGVTGGSWEDPIYLYSTYGALGAGASSRSLGFRCARFAGTATAGHDQGGFRIPIETRTPRYTPVAPAAYQTLLEHYRYDSRPLEVSVVATVETPDWRRQKIRYVAHEGDTALAYLFLPRQAAPPYQTIVYVSSSAAFVQIRTVPEEVEWVIGPNIRAGRAVLAPVFKGMAERAFGPDWDPPLPSSVRFRDLMVLHATEMRRGIDYLATRDDIDMQRLAYVALSWGAGSRLALAAVDERFRAVVLIGGGIDERLQPTLPEASNINFAPYIRPPKLLLNGRDDEEHPWLTRALPLWNLLREPKQLVLVPGGGHNPPLEARVPAINTFLDQTLGPVRR
jgi:pimeloyl-ACP methyl ester carboxylesterase